MRKRALLSMISFIVLFISIYTTVNAQKKAKSFPSAYNIIWHTPSKDALGSMPLSGRYGAGANVWVQDSSIWIYLAHNGAYDEQGRLLKLACIRITPTGVRLGAKGFTQELDLSSGAINITQGDFRVQLGFIGETLLFESKSGKAHNMQFSFGTWRDQYRAGILQDMNANKGNYQPDLVKAGTSGILWFHRNSDFAIDLIGKARAQGIPDSAVYDITTQRIFGGAIAVKGGITNPVVSNVKWQLWEGKAWTCFTTTSRTQVIAMRLGASVNANVKQWENEAHAMLTATTIVTAKINELQRWKAFWSRSYIIPNPAASPTDTGWITGRNYQLFRYMLACNRDGELPLLFNGGIFTVDNIPGGITGNNNAELPITEAGVTTPDFRRWMYCHFMSQNQRWLGWPTLAGGDTDLLLQSFSFYRNRSKTAAARASLQGATGVVYPEPLDIWGLCCVAPRADGLCGAEHLTYHFSMMLEHAWMALTAHETLGIPITHDLPWIAGTLQFYDSFYRLQHQQRTGNELGTDGKLVIYPSNGLEFAKGATNPIEVVSGLKRISAALLTLPELSPALKKSIQKIMECLPELPTGFREGKKTLLPAKSWEQEFNMWEPIEMYAYWPYRLVGVTKPETMELARDTWNTVPINRALFCKQDFSWMPNLINMAALGWSDSAKRRVIYKMANPTVRFPAFFGPGHDWLPDQNWGGSGMTGMQEMLLAADPYNDGKLYLLPAWPAAWDVDFKLHAPKNTIVTASVRKGKIVSLKVIPPSREKDIILDPRFSR